MNNEEMKAMNNEEMKVVEGVYETQLFRRGESLVSPSFPILRLITDQVFMAGEQIK